MKCIYKIVPLRSHNGTSGEISLDVSNTSGQLFINWINLPRDSIISSGGKLARNIPAGTYLVELEDDIYYGKTKKTITITIDNIAPLVIEFIHIEHPKCYEGTGEVSVFIEGGQKPYSIFLKDHTVKTELNSYTFVNIENNRSYTLKVIDSYGNIYHYPELIEINTKKIDISIKHQPIIKHGENCSEIIADIKNAEAPYKIGWYKTGQDAPIITNQLILKNMLPAGSYFIKVVDSNDCVAIYKFTLVPPNPIVVSYHCSIDYSYKNYFNYVPVEKIHNTILIPIETFPEFRDIIPGDHIKILNKKTKSKVEQSVVFDVDIIKLFNKDYLFFYIATGLNLSNNLFKSTNWFLLFKDKEYPLSLTYDGRYNKCRLIMGLLILSNNYIQFFGKNDKIEVNIDGKIKYGQIHNCMNKNNYYLANTNTTLLFILDSNNTELISFLNSDNIGPMMTRSITTMKNNKKGSISLSIYGGVSYIKGVYDPSIMKYKITFTSIETNNSEVFYTDRDIEITNLSCGRYSINIIDMGNNHQDFVNGQSIKENLFYIDILGSIEEEQEMIINRLKTQHGIDGGIINNGTFTKFKRAASTTTANKDRGSLLINIMPYNTSLEILGPDNFYQKYDNSYQLIENLYPGKYTLKINSKQKTFFIVKNDTYHLNSL